MKKNLFTLSLIIAGVTAIAQTPRLSLYEEFTGETCPPCASTNPGLNTLLASPTNTPKIVAIKWQVPIPSAPSNTWSLYQTNKTEIDWRWKSGAGNYGYTPVINSAPSSKIDGQEATVFGAASGHPANLNNNVIATAQSYTSAFSVTMNRDWDAIGSAVNLTVNIQATANFTAVGNLIFRTVMVEKLIQFSVQPGTNGEKNFEDAAIKSFPTLQAGVPMSSTWTVGQTQTFTLNCPIPSYARKKEEIAFVGFIQDDGNQKVAQAVRAGKALLTNDAMAVAAKVGATCNSTIAPIITVYNNGANAITALTITPFADAVAGTITNWSGNIASGASQTISLNSLTSPTTTGAHTFSYNITAMSGTDFNLNNNSKKVSYLVASSYDGTPVAEDFALGAFPPLKWSFSNPDGGTGWTRVINAGGFNLSLQSAKYDFFSNSVIGDVDELYLPPMDLSGTAAPILSFEYAYAQKTINSNDKLEVLVSSDCGATWTSFYSASGVNLSPTGNLFATAYVPNPNDISDWGVQYLTLTGFNVASVLVKFVTTNDNGNNLYIDNVNLSQSSPTGLAKIAASNVNVDIFPNPSNGETTLRINTPNAGKQKVSVLNTLGQVVYEKQMNVNAGSNTVVIDAKDFAAGIYNVVVDGNKGVTVKKLIVTK
jgi:hypothetical protein